ncbi:MAG: NUDIX domain-containing protein, partial [Thermoleophilia bacterium]|nr:NUDIX domain-containing protein [Thermoleophilia bacterium]
MAAVLVPVFRDEEGELRLLLVARVDDGGLHGGQLGLPGGRPEPGDADLRATALREAEEEIGLEPESVTVLA